MPVRPAQTKHVWSLLLGLTLVAGCGGKEQPAAPGTGSPATGKPAPAHDPDDVAITEADVEKPVDYAAAVKRIEGYRNTIRDEIAAGRPGKAHRPLDEVDIVLNWLPGIARDSGVPKEQWEEVNTTAQEVRDLFNKVHAKIDAKKEPDYGAVSDDLDETIAKLKSIQAKSDKQNQ